MAELKVEQHPDKTFIGRTERGFAFLGYQMNAAGLVGVAPPTIERFVERINRLYEQDAGVYRIGEYVRRWWIWVKSGLRHFIEIFADPFCASKLLPCPQTPPRHHTTL